MNRSLVALQGRRLDLGEYLKDYEIRFSKLSGYGTWKIERQQEFSEPGSRSWEAFHRGEWRRSLEILNEMRPAFTAHFARIASRGLETRRVRVVEEPLSPYLIWELNGLLIRAECGEQVRVVGREQVEPFERDGLLPEILAMGKETVYQVLYGQDGAAEGAIRSTDAEAVERWRELAGELYEAGEELSSYFARKVSGLRPPGSL